MSRLEDLQQEKGGDGGEARRLGHELARRSVDKESSATSIGHGTETNRLLEPFRAFTCHIFTATQQSHDQSLLRSRTVLLRHAVCGCG
jgi:hypothetical protein